MSFPKILTYDEEYVINRASEDERLRFVDSVLTEDQKKLLSASEDRVCYAIAKNIVDGNVNRTQSFKNFGIRPKFVSDYTRTLWGEWKEMCVYFLGEHVGHSPSLDEVAQELRQQHIPELHRIFYILRHPDRVYSN